MAKWISRPTSNREVAGSSPASDMEKRECNTGVTQFGLECSPFKRMVGGSNPSTGIMEGDTAHGAKQVEFPSGQRGQT